MAKPYVFIQDIAASWARYLEVAPPLTPPPKGMLAYAAGPTEEGVRVIGIWRSQAACDQFRGSWLAGVIASLGDPAAAERTLRALTPRQLLIPTDSHLVTAEGGTS